MNKSIRIAVYWTVLTITLAVSILSVFTGVLFVRRAWFGGHPRAGDIGTGWIVACFPLAQAVATSVCRRLGISVDSRTVEILSRKTTHTAPTRSPLPDAVELRWERWIWRNAGLALAGFALIITLLVLFAPAVPGTEIYGYAMVAIIGFLALVCGYGWLTRRGFMVRADAQGITYYPVFSAKRIAWEQIAQADIVTMTTVWGSTGRVVCLVKDANGKTLGSFSLAEAAEERQAAFIANLRAHLAVSP